MKVIAALACVAALLGTACASDDAGSLTITSPVAGATVTSPVDVAAVATGVTIEAAGEVNAGAGHLHIIVDAPCVDVGTVIPGDDTHIHMGDGSLSKSIELDAGEHTICVQVADGVHTATAITETVTFTVS